MALVWCSFHVIRKSTVFLIACKSAFQVCSLCLFNDAETLRASLNQRSPLNASLH